MRQPNLKYDQMFQSGKYKHFRKGDLYRDPRIKQVAGQKDFLIIDGKDDDFEFLRKYLRNELPNYPSEPYNTFTTGLDKNGEPMIGLYWVDEEMTQFKKAIILCRNECENAVIDIVDGECEATAEEGEQPVAEPDAKPTLTLGSLAKYQK